MNVTRIFLPCGSMARWDVESEIGYRCESCFAMLGSVGQPNRCKEESDKWKALKALGGKGWNYIQGRHLA